MVFKEVGKRKADPSQVAQCYRVFTGAYAASCRIVKPCVVFEFVALRSQRKIARSIVAGRDARTLHEALEPSKILFRDVVETSRRLVPNLRRCITRLERGSGESNGR